MQYLSKPLELSSQSEFSDDEIKEVKTMKSMELQADTKNRQSYKRLLDHYNINLKSNDIFMGIMNLLLEKAKAYYQSSKRLLKF